MWTILVTLAWVGLVCGYPLGAKRYGGLVPVGPRLYYEPDPVDLYYPGPDVQTYRPYTPPQYVYDYLPYSYYPDDGYQEEDVNEQPMPMPEEKEEDWSRDRTNKVFLQNLILAQMYQDALDKLYGYYPRNDDSSYVYGERVDSPFKALRDQDDEVEQLKSLEEQDKKKSSAFREEIARRRSVYPTNKWADNKRADKGQDEEVLLRPSVPRPSPPAYREPPAHRAYQPSPYDSVKKLLQLQDKLEQEAAEQDMPKTRPQKRSYVSSEESLVEQLGKLKKSA